MDKVRHRTPEYQLFALSVVFGGGSVSFWYGYVFHRTDEWWMPFSWLMLFLSAGVIALWLIVYGKWYGEFSRGRILFYVWCGLVAGWAAYLLISNERHVADGPRFEPWLLAGCVVVMLLAWLVPVLGKLVRTRHRKQ